MTLGYIVTSRRMKNIEGFVEQVNDISLADPTKPTLIVGWQNAKKDPRYSSILDKQLDESLFWTFSKTESRTDFEDDLLQFYDILYSSAVDKIRYYCANIFRMSYAKARKLMESVRGRKIYLSNGMMYIPYKDSVIGLSLTTLEYCRIPSTKVVATVKRLGGCIIEDNDKDVLRLSRKLGTRKYAIPHLI